MHFTFTGKEIDITSEDYIIVEAIDSISLVVGSDSIVITKDGIKIYGTSKITKSLTILEQDVSKDRLINGIGYTVNDDISVIILESTGDIKLTKTIPVGEISSLDLINNYTEISTGQIWKHLLNTTKYNNYYGKIYPYIIEYPFAYQYQDEILQNVRGPIV